MRHAGWNGPGTKGAGRTHSVGTRGPSVTGNVTDSHYWPHPVPASDQSNSITKSITNKQWPSLDFFN